MNAVFDRAAWQVPPLFAYLQERGRVDRDEMYRVFNMGIGMVVAVRAADCDRAVAILQCGGTRPIIIGWIEKGRGRAVMRG